MNSLIFKILALIFICAVLCSILKQKNAEYAVFISVATGVFIGVILLKALISPITGIGEILNRTGVDTEYFKVALKSVGIGYVTSFISNSCKDAGQNSLAEKAEFAGKCAIFIMSMPLLISIFNTCLGFLK